MFFKEKSASPLRYGVQSNDFEANVSIQDNPWKECCEKGVRARGEDAVSRYRGDGHHTEKSSVDVCRNENLRKIFRPDAFLEDGIGECWDF